MYIFLCTAKGIKVLKFNLFAPNPKACLTARQGSKLNFPSPFRVGAKRGI